MHNVVTQALERLHVGEPVTFRNLTMHPLLDGVSGSLDYLLLDEAVQDGVVRVTEVSEGGCRRHRQGDQPRKEAGAHHRRGRARGGQAGPRGEPDHPRAGAADHRHPG